MFVIHPATCSVNFLRQKIIGQTKKQRFTYDYITDRQGGKEAVQPTFHNTRHFFFCIFPMNFAMTTLGLKEMKKILWEGREKSLPGWLSQFSFA